MATKEDILEQLVEEYLLHKGYFVRHNMKYVPDRNHADFISNQDANHSDIDVIGYHPKKSGHDRIIVVSCKSWQSGFNVATELRNIEGNKTVRGRDAWRGFRELVKPKWSEAFLNAVQAATGSRRFTYVLAVTKVLGDRREWEDHEPFRKALEGNRIQLLTLREMVDSIGSALKETKKQTLAGTEIGRMLQLLEAAGMRFSSCTEITAARAAPRKAATQHADG